MSSYQRLIDFWPQDLVNSVADLIKKVFYFNNFYNANIERTTIRGGCLFML